MSISVEGKYLVNAELYITKENRVKERESQSYFYLFRFHQAMHKKKGKKSQKRKPNRIENKINHKLI